MVIVVELSSSLSSNAIAIFSTIVPTNVDSSKEDVDEDDDGTTTHRFNVK